MKARFVFFILFFFCVASAQVTIEGGNVTELNVTDLRNSTRWDGLYGDVILGIFGATYNHNVIGNQVVHLNMLVSEPSCTYTSLVMHIIAVNSSSPSLTLPLSPGNLSQLDAFINGSENGSATFKYTSNFTLSYGTFTNVPTTYTYANNASSSYFREGYLNDAAGNLVFVAVVVSNKPDWNGTTSDYQIMIPNNGSSTAYTLWVDINYTCFTPPPPGGEKHHRLYIYPPGTYTVKAEETFNPSFIVENRGDYNEMDVAVYIDECPAGFTCGSGEIERLDEREQTNVSFPITVDGVGEYVLTVCARNDNARACADFIVQVIAECASDDDCDENEYCDYGTCKPKKKVKEECNRDGECESGVCEGGICVYCTKNEDCAYDEICVEGICERIKCECGIITNHACIQYECCADSDCALDKFCIDHTCVAKELEILVVGGEIVENESILVQIVNNKNEPVPLARVFTDYMSVYADENGFATIVVPYNGLLYAYKDTYPQAGLLLDVIRLGFFITEEEIVVGKETRIRVVDSMGRGIAGATVVIGNDTVITDSEGYFKYVFDSPGRVVLKGTKPGYRIRDREINVIEREIAAVCHFPVLLNWLIFSPNTLYILWFFSILLALLNFVLSARRFKVKPRPMLKAALYSFIPLILALPNVLIFSICFMSNIVLLQAVVELILFVKRRLIREKEPFEKEK